MKAHLMFRDKDFEREAEPCFGRDNLDSDLELERILSDMAQKDAVIYESCSSALFSPLQSIDEIHYRQENLRDAFKNPDTVRRLYEITVETEKRKKESWRWLSSAFLSSTFSSAVELLKIYTEMLMKLRLIADSKLSDFQSEGFQNLLIMFQREMDDNYFAEVHAHLDELKDGEGTMVSAALGSYLQGIGYVLRRKSSKDSWLRWRFAPSFTIAPRDDTGAKDLGKRRDRAINEATNALAQAVEHLEGFFMMLRGEARVLCGMPESGGQPAGAGNASLYSEPSACGAQEAFMEGTV
ncbi:MAG: hypothetical protein QM793_06280 [Muricomes sp.]